MILAKERQARKAKVCAENPPEVEGDISLYEVVH